MSDLSSGLFALGGAIIGGVASWAGTVADARHRRQEAARDRLVKLTETRRVLYSSFVERSDVVTDAARDVVSYDEPDDVPDESEDRYLQAWDNFVQARASVEIVGPDAAAKAATDLYKCVADVCNQVDSWYFGDEAWTTEDDDQRSALLVTRIECRKRFVGVAQEIISAGDGSA